MLLDRLTQGWTMCYALLLNNCAFLQGFLYRRGAWGEGAPPLHDFFLNPPPIRCCIWSAPNLKMNPPPNCKTIPLLKNEAPFQKTIPWKKNMKNRKLPLKLVFHSCKNTGKIISGTKILDFILCYVLLKIVLFYYKNYVNKTVE